MRPEGLAALVDKLMAKDPGCALPAPRGGGGRPLKLYRLCWCGVHRLGALTPRPSRIVPAPDRAPPPALPFRLEAAGLVATSVLSSAGLVPGAVRRNSSRGCRTRNSRSMGRWPSTGAAVTGWPAWWGEAAESAGELAAQARSHREAAAAAARRAESAPDAEACGRRWASKEECERVAVALDAQAAEQQGHIARMRAQLAQVDATLGRLRSQGELLQRGCGSPCARTADGGRCPPQSSAAAGRDGGSGAGADSPCGRRPEKKNSSHCGSSRSRTRDTKNKTAKTESQKKK